MDYGQKKAWDNMMDLRRQITRATNKIIFSTKKNAPTILTVFGVGGVVLTAVLAADGHLRAHKMLDGSEIDIKESWKYYIPAVVSGTLTMVCIIGANGINLKRQAALASACQLTTVAYNEYKDKIKELLGEDKFNEIKEHILNDHTSKYPPTPSGIIDTGSGDTLWYEDVSRKWFKASEAFVLESEYHLNRNLCLKGIVSLNDFLDFLNIGKIDCGDLLGWSDWKGEVTYGYRWIDFLHRRKVLADGTEYYHIEYPFEPHGDYENTGDY